MTDRNNRPQKTVVSKSQPKGGEEDKQNVSEWRFQFLSIQLSRGTVLE